MSSWLVERRLSQTARRLRSLGSELAVIDEQLHSVDAEADDMALRALVSETPLASSESDDARKHADAMRRHRQHLLDSIAELEARQNALLDKLSESRA